MKGRLLQRKNVETPTEVPKHDASVQVSGCSECQSLASVLGDSTCLRCDRLNHFLSVEVDMKEEVKRLRSIRECEREIDWWCQILSAPRSWQSAEAPRGACHPLLPCKQVTEGNWQADSVPAAVSPLSSPPPSNNGEELGGVRQGQKAPAWQCRCAHEEIPLPPQLPLWNRYSAVLCRDRSTVVVMMVLPTWWCHQSLARPHLALKPPQQRENDRSLLLVTLC